MNVKVKICGIRTLEAAQVAIKAGVDFLGFNFVLNSKRYIEPADAAKIINAVKGKVKIVGVFQDSDVNYVNNLSLNLGLDFIQLHGDEDNEYLRQVKIPFIKAVQIDDKLKEIDTTYFLLDRPMRKGKMVDLKKATQLAVSYQIFYAGGLNPDNVAGVIRKVQPFAVDVAGGIETEGAPDLKKIKVFILRSKRALLIKNAKDTI